MVRESRASYDGAASINALLCFIALVLTLILLELCCVVDNHDGFAVCRRRHTVHSSLINCLYCTDVYLQYVSGFLSAVEANYDI